VDSSRSFDLSVSSRESISGFSYLCQWRHCFPEVGHDMGTIPGLTATPLCVASSRTEHLAFQKSGPDSLIDSNEFVGAARGVVPVSS
jgi:hypothetical protein